MRQMQGAQGRHGRPVEYCHGRALRALCTGPERTVVCVRTGSAAATPQMTILDRLFYAPSFSDSSRHTSSRRRISLSWPSSVGS
jgi:hypothetical protein